MPNPFSPDLPELRLLAQLANVKPSRIAAAWNNAESFSEHIKADELSRFLDGQVRVLALISRMDAHITPHINARIKAKGLKTNA